MADIPPNDPNHPRWLLDLKNWQLREYRSLPKGTRYGVISYTWGLYWDGVRLEDEAVLPRGIPWRTPRLRDGSFTLQHARDAVEKTGEDFVWWDWMCVPQGRPVPAPYQQAAGEEIAKQRFVRCRFCPLSISHHADTFISAIYRGAKSGIVWLHNTQWQFQSSIKDFLLIQFNPPVDQIPQAIKDFVKRLEDSQISERWLTSIWTLQEGVILHDSPLIDDDLEPLPGDFLHPNASVIDLSARTTHVAVNFLASALLVLNENPNANPFVEYLAATPSNRIWATKVLARLLQSGLVSYSGLSPLYILAGKPSRRFDPDNLDQYWALVGALDLANVAVSYEVSLIEACNRFFGPLLQRYQWQLLLIPRPPAIFSSRSWPQVISDGNFLPLGVYFDMNFLPDLPTLSCPSPDILLVGGHGPPQVYVFQLRTVVAYRRYRQLQSTFSDKPRVEVLGPELTQPGDVRYIQLANIPPRATDHSHLPGTRCIEIEHWNTDRRTFNGIVDIWTEDELWIRIPQFDVKLFLPNDETP